MLAIAGARTSPASRPGQSGRDRPGTALAGGGPVCSESFVLLFERVAMSYRTPKMRNVKACAAFCCAVMLAMLLGVPAAAVAQTPDPAGIATGDKSTVVDAGGTAFVVSEPTDKTAPDYADKKKAFDEYQAQAAKNRWPSNWPIPSDTCGSRPTPAGR